MKRYHSGNINKAEDSLLVHNSMKIHRIEATSAPDGVVKQILANIESGELQPGDRLPTQEQLGEMFGVGRSSIREATNALAIMGYLEIIQGRGTFIKSMTPVKGEPEVAAHLFGVAPSLLNLLEMRELLECYAIEKAADRASEERLEDLKQAMDDLEACREKVSEFLSADLAFHQAIANAAEMPELAEVVRHIHVVANNRLPVAFTTSTEQNIHKAIDTAQKICLYIVMGEAGQAKRCLRNHLAISREVIENLKE